MIALAPPPAPPRPPLQIALEDDDRQRFRLRLRMVSMTVLTILVTGWLCTLGIVPAVLSLMVAKHVLVAILAMGLGVDANRRVEA
jgi:hypothetical protein